MTQYRHNINCLTTDQLHDLREAWAILYLLPESAPHSYLHIAGIHGQPPPSYCIHGVPGFLTWHRAYLLALEEALQCLNPTVTVPFWDWSSGPTTGLPNACSSATYVNRNGDTVPNPFYAGPLPAGGPGSMTSRRSDIDTTSFADLATTAQNAVANVDFGSFQNALNGVHGSVHGRIGGNMGSVPYAGFDPIFHLHHANVDRLWAAWQGNPPGSLPPNEATLTLDPFLKPCSTTQYVGSDVVSTDTLGYRYTNFCFIIIGPFLLKALRLRLPPWTRQRLERAKLVVRTTRMQVKTMDLRVFVNDPKANARTPIEDNASYAGSLGVFGMQASSGGGKKNAARKTKRVETMRGDSFDIELDITTALKPSLRRRAAPWLTIVPVDHRGRSLTAKDLDFDDIELHIQ